MQVATLIIMTRGVAMSTHAAPAETQVPPIDKLADIAWCS